MMRMFHHLPHNLQGEYPMVVVIIRHRSIALTYQLAHRLCRQPHGMGITLLHANDACLSFLLLYVSQCYHRCARPSQCVSTLCDITVSSKSSCPCLQMRTRFSHSFQLRRLFLDAHAVYRDSLPRDTASI